MKRYLILSFIFIHLFRAASGLSSPPTGNLLEGLQTAWSALLSGAEKTPKTDQQVKQLKGTLLAKCQTKDVSRSEVEELIAQLAPLSPVTATAESPLLQRQWKMIWTTEKEINFFVDFGISENITQTIDSNTLKNFIEFKRGGGLAVSGELSVPVRGGCRTDFKFTSAKLDLGGRWGSLSIPPVGEGWFDTLYLDDHLRIDLNSRNDILVCAADAGNAVGDKIR